jgi:hypothetical protein
MLLCTRLWQPTGRHRRSEVAVLCSRAARLTRGPRHPHPSPSAALSRYVQQMVAAGVFSRVCVKEDVLPASELAGAHGGGSVAECRVPRTAAAWLFPAPFAAGMHGSSVPCLLTGPRCCCAHCPRHAGLHSEQLALLDLLVLRLADMLIGLKLRWGG